MTDRQRQHGVTSLLFPAWRSRIRSVRAATETPASSLLLCVGEPPIPQDTTPRTKDYHPEPQRCRGDDNPSAETVRTRPLGARADMLPGS